MIYNKSNGYSYATRSTIYKAVQLFSVSKMILPGCEYFQATQ